MSRIKVSVVICTHNRSQDLAACVAGLSPQRDSAFEYVVVDSASRPDEAAAVAKTVRSAEGFRLIRLDEPGLSLARNTALESVSGEWVALLDDDAVPAPDWTRELLRLLDILPRDCAALGGYVRPMVAEGERVPTGSRWRQLISAVEYPGEGDFTDNLHVVAANLLFRTSALREVGGFPSNLGRIGKSLLSGEDKLVISKLMSRGWRIWYSDRLKVDHKVHSDRLRRRWAIERAYWDGVSDRRIDRLLGVRVTYGAVASMALKTSLLGLLYFVPSTSEEFYLRFWYDLGWMRESLRTFSELQASKGGEIARARIGETSIADN